MSEVEFKILFNSVSFTAITVVNNSAVTVVTCGALNEREP